MTANGTQNMTELTTFLPQDGSNKDGLNKYKVTKSPGKGDQESDPLSGAGGWDPFRERIVEHPTTDCDTLTHLLKAALGTGILAMPIAFKGAGLSMGIFATVLVALVCTHCAYILVVCAHELYRRTKVTMMTFPDVGEVAFATGPAWGRKYAKSARVSILMGLFGAYFGTCSVYTVIIASNLQQVIDYYADVVLNERIYIAALLIPLIVLCWVPNLKMLAPISMVANLFMAIGLGITLYYLVWDVNSPADLPQFGSWYGLPQFFSITIFAMEAIGVVMPLENNMRTPQHFVGLCGVLNMGMSGVTMVYILLGFMGYLKYGAATQGSITLNLPTEEIAAQSVKVLIALAVYCTYGLQYFVCLEIVWNGVKDKVDPKNSRLYEYIVRTLLTTSTVVLAIAVPTIGPFLALIGALCFSFLGLVLPIFVEAVTFWETGFGRFYWKIWKNLFVILFGVMAMVTGSYTSLMDIVEIYTGKDSESLNTTGNFTTNSTLY